MLEEILASGGQKIVRTVVKAAQRGDLTAARLVMERLLPLRRGSPVRFDLPEDIQAKDVAAAIGAIIRAVASGKLTPDEGQMLAATFEAQRRAHETSELEARLKALEEVARQPPLGEPLLSPPPIRDSET